MILNTACALGRQLVAQFAHFSAESLSCTAHWGSDLSLDTCPVQMGAHPDQGLAQGQVLTPLAVFVLVLRPRKTARFAGFAAGLEWDPSLYVMYIGMGVLPACIYLCTI